MHPEGRTCWRGGTEENISSCRCASDPPEFNLAFPVHGGEWEISTVAPSPLTDDFWSTAVPTDLEVYVTSDEITAITYVANHTEEFTPRLLMNGRFGSLLIMAVIALLFLIIFLGCLLVCYIRKNKKRRRCITDRPATEGCETDGNQYELKPATPVATNQNDFDMIQIDCNDHNTRETPKTNLPKAPESPQSPEPTERRNYPILRTVRAIIVGDGSSPEKPVRPVSRQDSDAPLVKFETPVYRDSWKDGSPSYGTPTNNRTSGHLSAEIDPNWRYSGHSEKLSTLDEVAEKTGKEPTKLEFFPSRLFATPSILSSPAGKKSNRRPDSSTPLFDGDSLSSTEA